MKYQGPLSSYDIIQQSPTCLWGVDLYQNPSLVSKVCSIDPRDLMMVGKDIVISVPMEALPPCGIIQQHWWFCCYEGVSIVDS